ncbi:MAG: DUF4271 domain-containing protein [Chitinophagaceae bacterium]|nr:DUF4271 domain-containing protein [Chitinophagaceae bacterium]
MRKIITCLLFMAGLAASAQQLADTTIRQLADTLHRQESVLRQDSVIALLLVKDSVSKNPGLNINWTISKDIYILSPQFTWEALKHHHYFGFNSRLTEQPKSDIYQHRGKELLFYLLLILFVVFGMMRTLFPKFFDDLFRLFFRTTLKQKQLRDQLMQVPLPSILLNGFFVLSGGLYISFMIQHFRLSATGDFWMTFLYAVTGLSVVYFVKFVGLKISGWLFNLKEAADSYVFIVFIINKMLGIFLLPFLLLIAFSEGDVYTTGLVLSWCLVGGMLLYRIILTYGVIRNQLKVNPIHFFLYLLAFEIIPVLLVYKALLLYFAQTA